MIFSSLSFLYFFLPLLILIYFPLRKLAWKNGVLLLFSLLFYSWGEPERLILLAAVSVFAYFCALRIETADKRRKALFITSCAVLVGILVFFKYISFFRKIFLNTDPSEAFHIALPLGISFYTFQVLSYLTDIYRGNIHAEKSFSRFMLYVCFFPQLIMGPIIRYQTVQDSLSLRNDSWDNAIYGARRFIIGLSKKVLLADTVGLAAETVYSVSSEAAGTAALWLAAICYSLEIYYDFSGYSDMAIGLGRIFGFHLPENFEHPYAALSVSDFWRRWHISLTSWFRDYIYIPLGGNRVSLPRQIINIAIVWMLTGLWHGTAWNYLLWGLLNGVLLVAEKLLIKEKLSSLPKLFRHLYSLFFITVNWTVFHFEDFSKLKSVLLGMFSLRKSDWSALIMTDTSICMKLLFIIPAVIFSFPIVKSIRINSSRVIISAAVNICLLAMLGVSIMFIISSSYNPFIYFGF